MKFIKKIYIFLLTALFLTLPFFAVAATPRPPEYVAGAVTVMCADTGLVLYESNQHERHYPASIVKVMTALLVLENVEDLEETVVYSETAVDLPSYAASMGLREGDTLTVRQALYSLLLVSANETANALAEHVAGSVSDFVEMMNRRASELGAYDTHYVNACGLPGEGQHITAYDMSLIMREAVTHPVFVEIINTSHYEFPPSQRHPQPRTLRNTNRLVREGDDFYSDWVIGGKTGWIIAARNTLTTYARQENFALIVTVLFTDGAAATFADTVALVTYGFYLMGGVPLPSPPPPEEWEVPSSPGSDETVVVFLPGVGEPAPYPALEEPPETTPAVPAWELLVSFALRVMWVLAAIFALAGIGVIILLISKRNERKKTEWTSYSKTSRR